MKLNLTVNLSELWSLSLYAALYTVEICLKRRDIIITSNDPWKNSQQTFFRSNTWWTVKTSIWIFTTPCKPAPSRNVTLASLFSEETVLKPKYAASLLKLRQITENPSFRSFGTPGIWLLGLQRWRSSGAKGKHVNDYKLKIHLNSLLLFKRYLL